MNKYDKMWQEGKMPMQQFAKELIEKGIIPADLDYKSYEAVQLAIKYNQEQMEKKKESSKEAIKEQEEKRKTLPPLETWLDSDKTCRELHEMGYSYLEIMEFCYSL